MTRERKHFVDDVIQVEITNIVESIGAFAKMPNGETGLIRVRDFAWFNQVSILNQFKVGDRLIAKVIRETPDGKLDLSRRELLPNPRTLEKGTILKGIVTRVEEFGLIVKLGDFTALALMSEVPMLPYVEGYEIICEVIDNTLKREKNCNRVLVSILALHDRFAERHMEGEVITGVYKGQYTRSGRLYAIIACNNLVVISIPPKSFVEPYKSMLLDNTLKEEEELEFSFSYRKKRRMIRLDMRPIEEKRQKELKERLCSQITRGDIVEAEVISVEDKVARIRITSSGVECILPREELSPNKVLRASDEVFKGEHIQVVYLGDADGEMSFSRKPLIRSQYDESLYDLSLEDLLETMDLKTSRFIGQFITLKSTYFMRNLMTVGASNEEDNGKLLADPVYGNNLIVKVDYRLRDFFIEGHYYEVEIELASKDYRMRQGTPYMFAVASNDIREVQDPYEESVSLSFKQHTSPNTNTSVANLLEEVGKNLYSTKKRMFFELLQNADDAASMNGVKVKVQMDGRYFVLTHDGYSFNRHDFESITSAAKSTKRANDKKTGYKGIGFKSVFTNSHSVLIKSGGYEFAFDKEYPIYKNFEEFYFLVNDINDDPIRQAEFNHKYAKYKREFGGVKDIPWQLLPIWKQNEKLEEDLSIFNERNNNVSIALKMDSDTLAEYGESIKEVFGDPRFMLFLRNTNRVQLISGGECLTIQKNKSADGRHISLVNSSDANNQVDSYLIYSISDILVNDEEFAKAGVSLRRKERLNNKGDKENYFVRVDKDGNILGEVTGIPDRIASTKDTAISFAVRLNGEGHIEPLQDDTSSLYAYLPMDEYRFKFPFYVNADFIPKSDREGIQSDNPWNQFVFFILGKSIVKMVASYASQEESEYLNLLPTKELQRNSQDSIALVSAFNRGYLSALLEEEFILNDHNEMVKATEIIYDSSGLADAVGGAAFYQLIGTNKRLPNKDIKSDCLTEGLFQVEVATIDSVYSTLISNISALTRWLIASTDDMRTKFYEWLASDEHTKTLIPQVPTFMFGEEWKSISEISVGNKDLILTEKIAPMRSELSKLGFKLSNETLEDHPLCSLVPKQDEKNIFDEIQNSDVDRLTFEERLNLFISCAKLNNVGDETLRKWEIFKNGNGNYAPLHSLFACYQDCPQWLYNYMLNINESVTQLDHYLIPHDDIYTSVIEEYIDDILKEVDVTHVYKAFSTVWRPQFTTDLFERQAIPQLSMLTIAELSDNATKENYIRTSSQLLLQSSTDYLPSSFEYRWIKLASLNNETIAYASSLIKIDGKELSLYAVKDELNIKKDDLSCQFSLSKLLPSFDLSSALSKVISNFSDIPKIDQIFAQSEASPKAVYDKLCCQLRSTTSLISEEQFCFLMVYRATQGYQSFGSSLSDLIRVNDNSLFLRILDRTLEMGLAEVLSSFIRNGGVRYPFDKLIGTYFDSEDYTLQEERTPSYILSWANTPEKKSFLIRLGLHDDQSKEILRRKSFRSKKVENVWNIKEPVIRTFLKWVAETFTLPITEESQVKILESLFESLRIEKQYDEEDFSKATEWGNELYLKWKAEKGLKIYVIEGLLPYRGVFQDTTLFKGYSGDYIYFPDSETIYVSFCQASHPDLGLRVAALLSEIHSDRSLRCPFSKEDWNDIFLVSADVVKEKDDKIAELERMLEKYKKDHRAYDDEEDYGKATDKGNVSELLRSELNREARLAAKDYLDALEDYDCSEWDPDIGDGLVKDFVKYRGDSITVVVTSSKARKLYLHPRLFAELMTNPNNLLLNYGYDRRIHRICFDETFKDNKDVNLIFDAEIVTAEEFAYLASRYMYSKNTCFVIENIDYSVSDQIKGFGLDEKIDSSVVYTDVSTDDLFEF
ncbi:S1 RNA-binding domain-containing protein [Porphyromonas asaccharolytica]